MDKNSEIVKLNDELLDQVSGGYEQYWRSEDESSGPETTPGPLQLSEVSLEQTGMSLRFTPQPTLTSTPDMSGEKQEYNTVTTAPKSY